MKDSTAAYCGRLVWMEANAFGQYSHRESILHRLDPRTKILAVAFLSSGIFFISSLASFAAMSLFVLLLSLLCRMNPKGLLKKLWPFAFFFAFILLAYWLAGPGPLGQGIVAVWRFALLISLASVLTFSTTASRMVLALEGMLAPLRLVGLNPRDLALMLSATIRFVPLLLLEVAQIRDAQRSRLGSMKRLKHVSSLVNRLLLTAFARAMSLADAMEARCYTNKACSSFVTLKATRADYAAAFFVFAFSASLLLL